MGGAFLFPSDVAVAYIVLLFITIGTIGTWTSWRVVDDTLAPSCSHNGKLLHSTWHEMSYIVPLTHHYRKLVPALRNALGSGSSCRLFHTSRPQADLRAFIDWEARDGGGNEAYGKECCLASGPWRAHATLDLAKAPCLARDFSARCNTPPPALAPPFACSPMPL